MRKNKFLLVLAAFSFLSIQASSKGECDASPRSSTNVTVDTQELGALSINDKSEPENKSTAFDSYENSNVNINESGEPNLNMRF